MYGLRYKGEAFDLGWSGAFCVSFLFPSLVGMSMCFFSLFFLFISLALNTQSLAALLLAGGRVLESGGWRDWSGSVLRGPLAWRGMGVGGGFSCTKNVLIIAVWYGCWEDRQTEREVVQMRREERRG